MSIPRRIAFFLLCLCLCANGSSLAWAAPMSPVAHESMGADCAQMDDDGSMSSMSSMSSMAAHATVADHARCSDCKSGACCCVGAHGVASTAPTTTALHVVLITVAAPRSPSIGYASPAFARLVRPPIA